MRTRRVDAAQTMSFDFIEPSSQEERVMRAGRGLPEGDEALIEAARPVLAEYHQAVLDGDTLTQVGAAAKIRAIAIKMHGGTSMGMACDGGGQKRLGEALRAPNGVAPMWGQPASFRLQAASCEVLVEYEGLFGFSGGFAVRAVDYDKPFISNTGYHSFMGASMDRRDGKLLKDWVAAVIEESLWFNGGGKMLKRPKPLVPIDPAYYEERCASCGRSYMDMSGFCRGGAQCQCGCACGAKFNHPEKEKAQ